MFEGLKIPRAHATDTSGSEELTESVHTDYGSDVTSVVSVEEFQSAYSDLGGKRRKRESMFPADLLRCVGGGSGDACHMNDTT